MIPIFESIKSLMFRLNLRCDLRTVANEGRTVDTFNIEQKNWSKKKRKTFVSFIHTRHTAKNISHLVEAASTFNTRFYRK